MGLMGLLMAYHGGLCGILSGLTESTDHPLSRGPSRGENLGPNKGGQIF